MRRLAWIATGAALSLAATLNPVVAARQAPTTGVAPIIDDGALERADARAGEWVTHGRTYAETRHSPLKHVHDGNVERLKLAWTTDLGTRRGLEATPLIVGGVMYTTGSWSVVFALNARTGERLWTWDPEVPRIAGANACCDVVNRGVAFYNNRVFVGTIDGRLAAIDAKTGRLVWETMTVDREKPYTITGAPRVVKGNVIIGNGGADLGVRGYVSAYDAESGKMVWRFYTVPGDPSKPFESPALERAAKTWSGKWWEVGGGGTVWDAMAFDPTLDLLYVGTGNGAPWSRAARSGGEGDNLYLSSILALSPSTGALVWHYQTTPGDDWDFTATQHIILADLQIDGRARQVLMQAPKNGFFYVLDRKTGALISAKPFVPVNWATGIDTVTGRPIEVEGARYVNAPWTQSPGPLGAHNWHPMAFNPQTGLVYIPAQENSSSFSRDTSFTYRPGLWNTGLGSGVAGAGPRVPPRGYLLAWDPVAQQERWRVDHASMWNGGLLSTAGNLLFQGTAEGRFAAYRADTGARLWEVTLGAGILAPAVTYLIGDEQFVSVMVGWGGVYALAGANPSGAVDVPGRVMTFSLNGTLPLPSTVRAARELPLPILTDAPAEMVTRGGQLFGRYCSRCHGGGAAGNGGLVADLRHSVPVVFERYREIVVDGAASGRGMPAFKPYLSYEDADALRAYVLDRRAAMGR